MLQYTFTCLTCKEIFIDKNYDKSRKYCSKLCSDIGLRKQRVSNNCKNCGIEFTRYKSREKWAALKFCSRKCYAVYNRGENSPIYKGGSTSKQGYHALHIDGKQVQRGRYVMEQHVGRKLSSVEHVHHINGNRSDDRLVNLELWSISHPYGQRVEDKIRWAKEFLENYGFTVIKNREVTSGIMEVPLVGIRCQELRRSRFSS